MTTHSCDVVILGAGPAGLTAAIYASRAALDVIVLEGEPTSNSDLPGGQLMLTTEVENYPGFPDGVMGPDLISNLRTQASRFGARVIPGKAEGVSLVDHPFHLGLTTGETITARSVIVATGSTARMLDIGESRLLGHGVSTCATCDGFFFRGQDIAVVGGGDSALEEAIFLTKFANSVTVVHRRSQLRGSKIMQERALSNEKIRFLWDSEVTAVTGAETLESIRVRNVNTAQTTELPVTGLFLAIGHDPTSTAFRGTLATDDRGYILTEPGRTHTNIAGVFACGDVQDPIYRQAITSAGTGCMAAIDAERWLESKGDVDAYSANALEQATTLAH